MADTEEPFFSNMTLPFHISFVYPIPQAFYLNGFVSPILVFFTLVTNAFVVLILLRRHMRSPTNAILAAMAISDTFTGVSPLPVFIHFFSLENYHDFVEYHWCYLYKFLGELIPTIFHTASIWLTVALAIQRYIYICHTATARRFCTIRNVVLASIIIYVLAILSQITRFFDFKFIPFPIPAFESPNKTLVSCIEQINSWTSQNEDLYFNLYFWFRVIFIHFVPCTILVVINSILIWTLRTAQRRRMQLLKQNKKSELMKLKDSNCTTLMLVSVVGLFLLVELPLGVIMILHLIQNNFDLDIMSIQTFRLLTLISNTFILLSYPLNFFIYCGMSRQFRETFMKMFSKLPMPTHRECSHYASVPTENGRTNAETTRETML
ncbi:sex peptide receptor-like [Ostrea edulis]|uniref:sex peptide receptor-like n=1 Tax=Ostrea edulis TaxID=37623 RepID=UPI00209619A5|nr:sex peptide receptor-like [Ostrea edulis]XP_048778887.1 sex peptide receptor-like [Ostrea edulis]XP_048778888.1 sex peptide receptor-like [Ostrea edulis]XP_056010563.1 sex peptide receptor-like [Ostrea edulis]